MSLLDLNPKIPKQKLSEYTITIVGRNKIGKTTFANQFEKPYFLLFESGTSGLLTHDTNIIQKANELGKHPWVVFKKIVQEIIKNDGYDFKTFVIDPVGVAEEFCTDYITKKHNVDYIGDLEWGKGWKLAEQEWKGIIRKLENSGLSVLPISHLTHNNIKDGIGNEKDILDLDVSGKSGKFIKDMTDILLLLDYDSEGKRKIFIRPTTNKESGSRLDFGKTTIPLDYKEFIKAFKDAVKRNNDKQGVTEEMIEKHYKREEQKDKQKEVKNAKKKIIKFCKKNKITKEKNDKFIEKILGVSGIGEIETVEQVEKYLKTLKEKINN